MQDIPKLAEEFRAWQKILLALGESEKLLLFLTIGLRKHAHFYDRVPSRTVIARSEATWQSAF